MGGDPTLMSSVSADLTVLLGDAAGDGAILTGVPAASGAPVKLWDLIAASVQNDLSLNKVINPSGRKNKDRLCLGFSTFSPTDALRFYKLPGKTTYDYYRVLALLDMASYPLRGRLQDVCENIFLSADGGSALTDVRMTFLLDG